MEKSLNTKEPERSMGSKFRGDAGLRVDSPKASLSSGLLIYNDPDSCSTTDPIARSWI